MNKTIYIFFIFVTHLVFAQIKITEKQIIFGENQRIYIDDELENLERFTPNLQFINLVNHLLEEKLKKENLNLDNYYIQYIGIKRLNEVLIYANASCRKEVNFETELFSYRGGGKCYFKSLNNINQNLIEKFNFNAPK